MSPVNRIFNRVLDLLFISGTERFWVERLQGKIMALVYHRVDEPLNQAFLTRGGIPVIAPDVLEEELSLLCDLGARFLTFADLRQGIFPEVDELGVIVTFDDCFRDNYTLGREVLNSVGVRGVFFQCSAMIDGCKLIPEHTLYWLAERPETAPMLLDLARTAQWPGAAQASVDTLTSFAGRWIRTVPAQALLQQLEELRNRYSTDEPAAEIYPTQAHVQCAMLDGHEIGSHGHHHLHRMTLDVAGFERELSVSCERIEAVAGVRPGVFSYPFNGYMPGDQELCARYFAQAVTVDRQLIKRNSDPLALARFSWPGPARSRLRQRRWLLTGTI